MGYLSYLSYLSHLKFDKYVNGQPGLILRKPEMVETSERWGFRSIFDPLYWIKHPAEYYETRLQIRSMYIHGMFRYIDEHLKSYIIDNFKKGSDWDYDFMQAEEWKNRNSIYGTMHNRTPMDLLPTKDIENQIRMYNYLYRFKMHRVV